MISFAKDTWFEKPTQIAVKIEYPTEEVETFCGVGYHNKVICGCCGAAIDKDWLVKNYAVYKVLEWIPISEEIAGGEDPFDKAEEDE